MKIFKGNKEWKKFGYIMLAAIGFRLMVYFISYHILGIEVLDYDSLGLKELIANWSRWDSSNYTRLATMGYANFTENGQHLYLVFYPLYAYLIRALWYIIGNADLAGLLLSVIFYGVGCCYTYALLEQEEGFGKRGAICTIILISVFPFGFFLGGIMTEGLFFALSAACLYYIRRHKWWRVAIVGALLTMTRTQGILLCVPALWEMWLEYRPDLYLRKKGGKPIKDFILHLLILANMFWGTVYYLFLNYRIEGNPFQFMTYQKEHWGQSLCFPWETLSYLWRYAFGDADQSFENRFYMWIPETILLFVGIVVLILGIRKIRATFLIYGALYIWLTYSVTWLLSGGRYMACCIPMFMVLGYYSAKYKWLMPILTIGFFALMVVYLGGYMTYQQIM